MLPERFTIKSREAVLAAGQLAEARRHPEINSLHLLESLTSDESAVCRRLLTQMGLDTKQFAQILAAELGHLPEVSGGNRPQVGVGARGPWPLDWTRACSGIKNDVLDRNFDAPDPP